MTAPRPSPGRAPRVAPRLRWALAATLVTTAAVALTSPGDDAPAVAVQNARRATATPTPLAARKSAPASQPSGAWPTPAVRAASAAAWPALSTAALASWSPPVPPAPLSKPAAPSVSAAASAALAASAAAAATAAAPSEPEPPPFPYQLIGRLEEGDAVQAMLLGPQRTLGARTGDVIDGQWRVDAVGADGLALTWLPGGRRQTLTFRPS